MTSTAPLTRRPRPCVAAHLGCACADRTAHAAWVDAHAERVAGHELRDGDTVHACGRWVTITAPVVDGDTLRFATPDGWATARAASTYARIAD